jgi:hypothetical protein
LHLLAPKKNQDASARQVAKTESRKSKRRTDLRDMLHVPRAPDRAMCSIPAHPIFLCIKSEVRPKSSREAVQEYTKTKIKFGLKIYSRHYENGVADLVVSKSSDIVVKSGRFR